MAQCENIMDKLIALNEAMDSISKDSCELCDKSNKRSEGFRVEYTTDGNACGKVDHAGMPGNTSCSSPDKHQDQTHALTETQAAEHSKTTQVSLRN